jgi:hypothetical protein
MYARSLRKASQTRRFIIRTNGAAGWQVIDERDAEIVRSVSYDDWHRVERAKAVFAIEAVTLRESGWTEN